MFLIVDRHAVHRAKKVQEWLAEHEDRIRLFLKRNIFRGGKAKDKPELMGKLRGFLYSRQSCPHNVKKY